MQSSDDVDAGRRVFERFSDCGRQLMTHCSDATTRHDVQRQLVDAQVTFTFIDTDLKVTLDSRDVLCLFAGEVV